MATSQSKKSKTENNSAEILKEMNIDDVPVELAMDIFIRLPLKSVARCLLLSKFWTGVIRSRDFITSFQVRYSSMMQPRLLVAFIDFDRKRNCEVWHFFSLSTSSSTSYLSRVTCPFPESAYHSHYVNGLINLGYGLHKCIVNPSTGTSIAIPRVETSSTVAHSFFGYDPVNDEYKLLVLCMKEKLQHRPGPPGDRTRVLQLSSEHQVVTLGDKNKPWRMIDYRTPHGPVLNSVCIDGVLFYLAYTGDDLLQLSLMRFDLGSEKLDLFTSVSADFPTAFLYLSTLISYKGKVALATTTGTDLKVWVLDQQAENLGWLKESFSIKIRKKWKQYDLRVIRGTTHRGELILAPRFYYNEFYVFLYNPDTNSLRGIKVKLHGDYKFKHRETKAVVFSDYVESVRLL
ncbi:PREDICTED: F-box protein At4g11590-like [Camelina sativa]|uniref:F-box protein At4g11590-like n=1 Tax=Camelina sativa TaxID=90675 RepID=A0ABM0U272_CAMSA|nr:PREDICTED: F-box protein At4g11590-like [Camelina sativa]